MESVEIVVKAALRFYNDPLRGTNGRYRSWEHCYKVFYDARLGRKNGETPDNDYLSLHLAFYLASWGMYRGSSFLLQQDYKVHEEAVKEILHEEYDVLQGIDCKGLRKEDAQKQLWKLKEKLRGIYDGIRTNVMSQCKKSKSAENKPKTGISGILISKILMGTLGCTPAYDRFFLEGIKGFEGLTGVFNQQSISRLIDFYKVNSEPLESVRRTMHIGELEYPQMKLLDMGFWQIGKEKDDKKRENLNSKRKIRNEQGSVSGS